MFIIPRDSEVWRILEQMVTDPDTPYIRVSTNDNMHLGESATKAICLSRGQGMWTHPLTVEEV